MKIKIGYAGFIAALVYFFGGLKLCGVIHWDWVYVLCPIVMGIAAIIINIVLSDILHQSDEDISIEGSK